MNVITKIIHKRKIVSIIMLLCILSFFDFGGTKMDAMATGDKVQSNLTGEWKDGSVTKRRPFALVVANNKAALPQYGISRAGVFYEAPVEGGMTRLMVFVEDYDDLERIGPARSARDYFVYEAMGRGAVFSHWGLAVPYCGDLINGSTVDNISAAVSGIKKSSNEAFKRYSRPGKALEFTGYMTIDGYKKAVGRHGYAKDYPTDYVKQFTFAEERVEYSSSPGATKLYPGGKTNNASGYGSNKARFEYNAEDKLYYRYQYGDKQIDEMNNTHLAVTNVVFQYISGDARDANGYLYFNYLGTGTAKVFTNGRMIEGTWKRDAEDKPAKFYDASGQEIVLNKGKTWICVIWEKHSDKVIIE